jgi:hypothetical protein
MKRIQNFQANQEDDRSANTIFSREYYGTLDEAGTADAAQHRKAEVRIPSIP